MGYPVVTLARAALTVRRPLLLSTYRSYGQGVIRKHAENFRSGAPSAGGGYPPGGPAGAYDVGAKRMRDYSYESQWANKLSKPAGAGLMEVMHVPSWMECWLRPKYMVDLSFLSFFFFLSSFFFLILFVVVFLSCCMLPLVCYVFLCVF